MGIVYKAEDTRLDRLVALKFLPAHLLGDEDVRKRFEREAKAAAALDHSNICTVHEIDEAEGKTFIAMALLEGESLDKRIAQGPLKLEDALSLASQIANGLEAAHEKGIFHRDIKPENVIVDSKGHVTIMDFGLAQLTEASRLTKTDQTMGTVFYMSPEQTEGSGTDNRTDIWSLGVVLYEMITGQKPFKGDYDKAVMYSILNEEPEPITALRTGVPMELEVAVNKAIAKSPEQRYQNTGDLVVDLRTLAEKLKSSRSRVLPPSPTLTLTDVGAQHAAPSTWMYRWILAATAAVALVLAFVHFTEPTPERPIRRFSFTPDSLYSGNEDLRAAVSPDGRWIVYISDDTPRTLWLRAIDSEEPRKLEGSGGAGRGAFWSPDSRFIGFAAGEQLKKVGIQGGPPIVLCNLPGSVFVGGGWSPDGGTIVFSSGASEPVLYEVSAEGGKSRPFPEPLSNEKGPGNTEPHFLPAEAPARSLLLSVGGRDDRDVYLWNLESGEAVMLVEGAGPVYAAPGFIVYQPRARRPGLWALPFSVTTLKVTGEAFPIAQGVGEASLSADGTLVSVDVLGGASKDRLVWRDRTGEKTGEIGRPQYRIDYLALSPDGLKVAVRAQEDQQPELWLHEVDRPVGQRLTFESGDPLYPSWSPDGKLVAYALSSDGNFNLYIRSADDSTQAETLVASASNELESDWSPDGRSVIYTVEDAETGNDLWVFDRQANNSEGEATPFISTAFSERTPQISPDGAYVAYCSDESGAQETYVREFPSGSGRRQISENGGCQPRWSHDGKELFYVEGDTLVAVEVTTGADFRIGRVERLFPDPRLYYDYGWNYDVSAGGRFVMVEEVPDETTPQHKPAIHITQNWYEQFRDREQD